MKNPRARCRGIWVCLLIIGFSSSLAAVRGSAAPAGSLAAAGDTTGLSTLSLADFLWDNESWDGCFTECLRYTYEHPDGPFCFYAAYRGGMCLRMAGHPQTAVDWLRNSLAGAPEPFRHKIMVQLAVAYSLAGQDDLAELELFGLAGSDSSLIGSNAALLQCLMALQNGRWEKAEAPLRRARPVLTNHDTDTFSKVDSLVAEIARRPETVKPGVARWLSTVVPGSGQIYAGNYAGGIAGTVYFAVATLSLVNTIPSGTVFESYLVFSSLWLRSYMGSRVAAARDAEERNSRRARRIRNAAFDAVARATRDAKPLDLEFFSSEVALATRTRANDLTPSH